MSHRRAFTLVELLVVVAIVVVLLAMLIPAMQKAVYQVMMVKCMTNQRRVIQSVLTYAGDNLRYYPVRPGLPGNEAQSTSAAVHAHVVYVPSSAVQPAGYDMRPILRDKLKLDVNTATQCPLVEPIDLEARQPDEYVYGNQAMWFGWSYEASETYAVKNDVKADTTTVKLRVTNGVTYYEGMEKVGDRFVWSYDPPGAAPPVVQRHSLLISDIDLGGPARTSSQTAHPDISERKMYNALFVRVNIVAGAALPHTASFWWDPAKKRGPVDQNYGYDDGSVRRLNGIAGVNTPGTDNLPVSYKGSMSDVYQVPEE